MIFWRSRDDLVSYVFLWTPSHRRASVVRPPRTYLQQLSAHTGYNLEDLPEARDNKDE